MAGVPPKNMTPPMSIFNISRKFQKYSKLEKVIFDGAVAGVMPPMGSTGIEIVANEMEGELATAGIKEAAKLTDVDFRNPCFSIDFGTTLDGRITSPDQPYAKTVGNFCGYAGAIPDAIVRGSKLSGFKSRDCSQKFLRNRNCLLSLPWILRLKQLKSMQKESMNLLS